MFLTIFIGSNYMYIVRLYLYGSNYIYMVLTIFIWFRLYLYGSDYIYMVPTTINTLISNHDSTEANKTNMTFE